jgi:putative peptidoglycan lipid II flippase
MSHDRTPEPKSPRAGGWQPRDLVPGRFRRERPAPAAPPVPALPAPSVPPALVPAEAAARAARPPREEYTPFVPSVPLPSRRTSAIATSDVGGDIVLAADGASTDLATASMGRLGGKSLAMAGLVVVAGVFLSRVLGLVRLSVFSAEFGASKELDAFLLAFRIPDLLFQLVAAGAVGSALVPVASELIARGEDERARRLISTIGNLLVVVMAPLAALIWLLAPVLVPLFVAPGFSEKPELMQTTIFLTQLMLASPILLAVGAVMAAGLNSLGIFGPSAMAPNVYNLVIIGCAIVLTPFFGISALAVGVILGGVGHILTQTRQFASNHLYEPVMDLHDPAVRETLVLMGPRALGLGATQLVFLVFGMFTSTQQEGDVTLFFLAFTALQIPVGLIGVPLGIILLPPLSRAFSLGQHDRFRGLVDQSLRLLLFVVIPLTGLMIVLAGPTLGLLYGYGRTSEASVATMVPVFVLFLFGLVAHVLISFLAPVFYAGKDTRTPVSAALLAVAVDIGVAVVLFPSLHLQGLAIAIGLGAWAEVVMLVVLMEKRIGFDLRPLARHSVSFAGGACVASAAAYMTARFVDQHVGGTASIFGRLAELAPAGLIGLAVYLTWARLFNLPELQAALGMARSLVRRRRVQPEADEL